MNDVIAERLHDPGNLLLQRRNRDIFKNGPVSRKERVVRDLAAQLGRTNYGDRLYFHLALYLSSFLKASSS
jgi:hypothetical protein